MDKAIAAYLAAETAEGIREAYFAMLEWSSAEEGHEEDDIDSMLERLGHPSRENRLAEVAYATLTCAGEG
jgi:hypothetical protein